MTIHPQTVAALFVAKDGCYFGLPDVDPWDEARDARLYAGPWPVVAHPPCARWCRLAGFVEARWGHKRGDDGGCFAAALASVRQWGGVLEHPADSAAWRAFDLCRPVWGAWTRCLDGGWVCEVHQSAYGHPATKRTWLYAYGCEPSPLDWSSPPAPHAIRTELSSCRGTDADIAAKGRPRKIGHDAASATPPAFRDVLLAIARGARRAP